MLYEHLLQNENAQWDLFKKAEQEAQRREALRGEATGGRVRPVVRAAVVRIASGATRGRVRRERSGTGVEPA